MKFHTIRKLKEMEYKEFDKLYVEKLEEIEKQYDQEKYFCEEKSDVLELFKLKVEELDNFLKNEEIESCLDFNNILEDKLSELMRIYEMYLLATENHSRGVKLVFKYLQDSFRDSKIKIEDISDKR